MGVEVGRPFAGADEAARIVRDAYVYAYPMVLMTYTSRQATNYAKPTGIVTQSPYNQFTHARELTPVDLKIVVRPNVDTLYTTVNLDLGPEPIVLSVPATDRYFHLPILSFWTDVFAVPGTRTTGRGVARDFLLVGPGWSGEVPDGLSVIKSPTRFAAIIGRTQTNGPADYDTVHAIQDGYKLRPLSAWGDDDWVPPIHDVDPDLDMKTLPPVQVAGLTPAEYFGQFAEMLKDNPPQPTDYPMRHLLERVGFVVGESFDLSTLPGDLQQAFADGTAAGKAKVAQAGEKAAGHGSTGWVYETHSGAYGVDYEYRAAVANFGLGENLPQDAVYPSLKVDADGQPLHADNAYVLRFEGGQLPPVDAFWSVTAYDTDGYLIPNELGRQALGDRDPLVVGADGSVELYLQANEPTDEARRANWLPVAAGQPFNLMLRLYSPREEILERAWVPPLPARANNSAAA